MAGKTFGETVSKVEMSAKGKLPGPEQLALLRPIPATKKMPSWPRSGSAVEMEVPDGHGISGGGPDA